MTCLLRVRGSALELAKLFDAAVDTRLDWRASIWTGEPVPVALNADGGRRLTTMRWGLAERSFSHPTPLAQRGTVYPRDFGKSAGQLASPSPLARCLIAMESFAYPGGAPGQRTRCWFGLWDRPLLAWAGVCDDEGCAGVFVNANTLVEPLSDTMPCLLAPEDCARWLTGASLLSIEPMIEPNDLYREDLAESWSTGRLDADG